MGEADILSVKPDVTIYGKKDCDFCTKAKEAFDSIELAYQYTLLADALGLPNEDGTPRRMNPHWRTDGTVELQAMWVMCGQPTPFIVVDRRGYANLRSALDAIGYRERKKQIVARKKREREDDSRSDA